MKKLQKEWGIFEKLEMSIKEAREIEKDQPYKLELIDELEKEGNTVCFYKSGDFIDLCKGPHIEKAGEIGPFKLLNIAGAYWRGSEKNKMLTRIYGTCFPTQQELEEYLKAAEEAKKNDHRKLGQELDLYALSDEIGPGLILWLPKGTIIKEELEKFGKETEDKQEYQRISTPHITKEGLYKMSGHLPYYADTMYPPMKAEEGNYYLKPMNCPHTHMVYKARQHSYRDLPIRYAEYGTVYRYEKSGELMGLLRVRGLTQNDAHIYCTEEQVMEELTKVIDLHAYYYKVFGLNNYYIELALPDFKHKNDKYFENSKGWEKAVKLLKQVAKASNIEIVENIGGAAFYGPKFDFNIKSITGREFGASTNQLDFGSGERFGLKYADKDGSEKIVPYIIHRAPLGSDERFIGFLIEHYGGKFPLWLSPAQVVILPIADRHTGKANEIAQTFKDKKIRTEVDDRQETLQAKIRAATLQKVPYICIIGDREAQSEELVVSVRTREGKDSGQIKVSEFLQNLKEQIDKKV